MYGQYVNSLGVVITGAGNFEGRTFAGWHHHTALVTAAHLFVTTLRLTADPRAHGAA